MSSLGEILRQAREAKGYTQSKVAAETRILVQIINDIENEDFHRIAAPIYGRGFVKLYAELLGLDPKPLITEFMDIYAGRRAPTVRIREVSAPAEPQPQQSVTVEPPKVEPPPVEPPPVQQDFFNRSEDFHKPSVNSEEIATSRSALLAITENEIRSMAAEDANHQSPITNYQSPITNHQSPITNHQSPIANHQSPRYEESPYLSPMIDEGPSALERFRTSLSSVSDGVIGSVRTLPRSTWRKAALGVAALAILALIVFACVKLYQFTTPPSLESDSSCENGLCEFNPSAKPSEAKSPAKNSEAKSPAQKTSEEKSPAQKTSEAKSPAKNSETKSPAKKLRSTGQKVPPLYVD